ncbi:TlpA family protein disulfide reductase [Salisaeta longa]|uniref:TlpA family protein disulfide reductase n=1 Tax=Salisaeta longa TaxID=503170 RepID=UPI000404890C|nr:thioredoxin family protein [Salisaeta longa]
MRFLLACAWFVWLTVPVHAQSAADDETCVAEAWEAAPTAAVDTAATSAAAPTPTTTESVALNDSRPALSANAATAAEQAVQQQIRQDGVHVVHFWAPWCGNSLRELKSGWADLVEAHPNVTFTFVTVWNNGQSGADTLAAHNIPGRVTERTLADLGPNSITTNEHRRRQFLGLPVTWIPTTWIFHNNGELAFALNYGELPMDTLARLIGMTQQEW